MNKEKRVVFKDQTDEEVYQQLKKSSLDSLMDAEEWKKLRIIELKRKGKVWSK